MSDSLQVTDAAAQAVAVAPRVSIADIEASIAGVYHTTADKAVGDSPKLDELALLSICIVVMRNGFVIIGKSAPASAANFDPDLGRRFAYEDAIRQLWPLMGFALRAKLEEKKEESKV